MKLTRHIFRWHHWSGLIVGIFLLLMSISGSLLVFSDEFEEIEERSNPQVSSIKGITTIDNSYKNVTAEYPSWEIRLYDLPVTGKALVYDLRKKEERRKVFADPVNGNIIGEIKNGNRSLQRQLLLFHYTLFSGTKGKIIVFFAGILFMVSLISGIIIYRRALLKVFSFRVRINRKSTRSTYSSLHRIIGVWALIFNLLIVATGLWLSGQISLTALKSPAKSLLKNSTAINSIDAVVNKIRKDYPDFEIHLTRIRPGNNTVQLSGRLRNDPPWYGKYYSSISVNGKTLQVVSSQYMKDITWNQRLAKMAGPLHFGNYGGIPLKIIYCLLGLTPGFLSVSGFILWRKRKVKKFKV